MVYASLQWSERGSDDFSLWYLAFKHLVCIYNQCPRKESVLTPLELLTKTKSDHRDILRRHVWVCPVFVLETKCKMTKICLNGIGDHIWVNFWGFQMIILLLWQKFVILV